jgi:WD40 repeat protein
VASATVARSRQLAASALNIFSTNPDRSLLMSVQGNQFQSNSEAQDSLMRTLQRQPLGLRAYIPNDAAVGTVGNVITSPDGRVLVTIGQGGRIGIRDLVAGTALRAPSAPVTGFGDFPGAAFSADGTWLVLQTSDSLVLWDVAAGRTVATLPKPFGLVEAAVISPDHRQLGVAADDGLHLLAIPAADGSSPSPSATTGPIALPAQFTPFRLAFSGDAGLLAVSGLSGSDLQAQVLVFDTGSGAQVATLPADTGGCQCLEQRGTAALTFAGQGGAQTLTSVAIHASDSTLISWQVGTWARVRTVPTPSALTATEQVVAVNADDTRIATSDGVDGLARIRDLVSGALVGPAFDAHLVFCSTCGDAFAQEGALAFGPSGTLVAAGSDSYVRWFDPSRNAPLSTPVAVSPDPSRLGSKTLSADGRVAAAVDVTAGQVVVLDATTGRVIRSLAAPGSDQSFVTLSPDGGTVVVGNDVAGPPGSTPSYVLSAWAVGTGQLLWQRPTDIVLLLGLIFDPSSQLVAAVGQPLSLSDELIELVDGATGGAVGAPTTIPFGFTQPAFSPDGAVITMGSLGPTFSTGAEGLVYGVAQHKVIRELHDPRLAGTAGIVISGDGRVAVAYPIGSGTISVLDGTTFAIRRQFLTSVAVSEVAISADGQRIVARSRDGTLQLFGTDFGEPIGDPIGWCTSGPRTRWWRSAARASSTSTRTRRRGRARRAPRPGAT